MAEGLIGEQNLRLHGKGTRDCHALAHATGQFVRISISELAETEPIQPRQAALALLSLRYADELKREARIIECGTPGQQPVLLENGRYAATEEVKIGVRALVADMDGAVSGSLEPDHQVEERRLAAAGLPDDCHDLARRNGEVEPLDRNDRLSGGRLPEDLTKPGDADRRRSVHARHRNRRVSIRATIASSRNSSATSTIVQAKTSATENSSCATDS